MRWTRPEAGAKRTVRRFLWIPKRIGNITRWLEKASWEQTYCDTYKWGHSAPRKWEDIK